MNTVITKGNNVRQYDPDKAILCISDIADCIAVNSNGKVIVNEGNPITWPTAATNGLQAIVDVKAGTLRFAYDGWPRAQTEFVVSEYVESVTSAPHIFDLIDYWPDQRNKEPGLDAPEGWEWKYFGDDWCLSNGTVGLKHDDWFKYKFGDTKPAKSFGAVEDCGLSTPVHVLDLIKEWPTDGSRPAVLIAPPGFSWRHHDGGVWSICGMNGDTEFFEGHWLNYHENKKKYANDHCGDEGIELTYSNPVTAASMLTAALGHMEDRAKTYDAPGGERSMGKTVAAFNTITGLELTEEHGWLFMEILKQVRSQQGNYRADNYEDMVAYAALRGECAARERGNE